MQLVRPEGASLEAELALVTSPPSPTRTLTLTVPPAVGSTARALSRQALKRQRLRAMTESTSLTLLAPAAAPLDTMPVGSLHLARGVDAAAATAAAAALGVADACEAAFAALTGAERTAAADAGLEAGAAGVDAAALRRDGVEARVGCRRTRLHDARLRGTLAAEATEGLHLELVELVRQRCTLLRGDAAALRSGRLRTGLAARGRCLRRLGGLRLVSSSFFALGSGASSFFSSMGGAGRSFACWISDAVSASSSTIGSNQSLFIAPAKPKCRRNENAAMMVSPSRSATRGRP